MRYLRRLSCVLVVVVTLFATFSITANAETQKDYKLKLLIEYSDYGTGYMEGPIVLPSGENYIEFPVSYVDENAELDFRYHIYLPNNEIIAKKGKTVNVTITDVHLLYYLTKWQYIKDFTYISVSTINTDGTYSFYDLADYSFNQPYGTFSAEFETEKDVVAILFDCVYYPTQQDGITGSGDFYLEYAVDEVQVPVIQVDIQNEEVGLLKSLIQWVKNIANSITELPQKIWEKISDGLTGLFVPDGEYMADYSDKWDELLSDRFGAIYQVADVIITFVKRIVYTETTNTIYIPESTISFGETDFTFGGQYVQIVPDGFEFLSTLCKMIVSVVSTFLFINGLRKQYDEVMGVEQ